MRRLIALAALALAACRPDHPTAPDPIRPPTAADEVVLIPFPSGAPTWDNWAHGFVTNYCVECHSPTADCGGSGCHAPGDPALFDFRDEAEVTARADVIRCGTAATALDGCAGIATPKTFPKWNGHDPLPTDEQRALVVAWLASGAP